MKCFEQMEVWQRSQKFLFEIKKVCQRDLVKRDFSFVDQITRASRSISLNIAEGFDSLSNKEFIKFLGYSIRSAGEVRCLLYEAKASLYITEKEFNNLRADILSISKMLGGFIRYLSASKLKKEVSRFQSVIINL